MATNLKIFTDPAFDTTESQLTFLAYYTTFGIEPRGNSPIFVFTSNGPDMGKTFILDTINAIFAGNTARRVQIPPEISGRKDVIRDWILRSFNTIHENVIYECYTNEGIELLIEATKIIKAKPVRNPQYPILAMECHNFKPSAKFDSEILRCNLVSKVDKYTFKSDIKKLLRLSPALEYHDRTINELYEQLSEAKECRR